MENPGPSQVVQEKNPERSNLSSREPRNFLLPFVIIGIVLFAFFPISLCIGLFEDWKELPPPPAQPNKLLGTSDFFWAPGNVYIQADDGKIYSYSTGDGKWSGPETEISELNNNECRSISAKFFPLKSAFTKPYECVMAYGHGDIAPAPEFSFVLDRDGNLWGFSQTSPAMLFLFLPIFVPVGALAGVVVTIVCIGIRRIKINKARQQMTPYGLGSRAQEIKIMKVVARMWSVISILYFVPFLLENRDMTINVSVLIAILTLIAAWRWPLHGGIVTIFAYLVMGLSIVFRGDYVDPGFYIILNTIFFFPGLLFILSWYLNQKYSKETSQKMET
jgi:hypothetical protein